MCIAGMGGLNFARDLGVIWENLFWSWRCHRKICRLFTCIPIIYFFLGGGGGIKNGGMCNNYKKRIVTSFLCLFMVEKGMCKLGVLGSCKSHYFRAI